MMVVGISLKENIDEFKMKNEIYFLYFLEIHNMLFVNYETHTKYIRGRGVEVLMEGCARGCYF